MYKTAKNKHLEPLGNQDVNAGTHRRKGMTSSELVTKHWELQMAACLITQANYIRYPLEA